MLSKLTSSSFATPPGWEGRAGKQNGNHSSFLRLPLQGEKAKCQPLKLSLEQAERQPLFYTYHRHQHPPSLQLLPFHYQFQSLPLSWEALPPSRKQHRESGKQAGMESLRNCLLMAAAPLHSCSRGFPSPRTVKQPIGALSFLQPSLLGCWLGFLKQSLASSLAAS